MPFFSVVVPTYNAGIKLKDTIESVLNQTFDDFELLIMDDGSIDDTKTLVESFSDSRIKYEWKPNSGGPATPRNRGLIASSAPWVSFLDADDIWHPRKLEIVNTSITDKNKSKIDVFCHNEILNLYGVKEKKILKYGPYSKDFYYRLLTRGNCVSTSAVTVRRDFIKNNNIKFNESKDFVIIEDYDFWLNLANKKAKFFFLNETLGEYVIENHNISHNTQRSRQNTETVLKHHVFNVQKFESKKEKLWAYLNIKLKIEDIIVNLNFKYILTTIFKILNIFLSNPIIASKIISIKFSSRIRAILFR